MLTKINTNLLLALIIVITLPLATLLTLDDFMPSDRTWPITSVTSVAVAPDVEPATSQQQSNEKPVSDPQATPTQNTSVSRSTPPPVEERIPGSPLSEKAKVALGIIEDIPEEQVFYTSLAPNDPVYPQWYTNNISAPAAWDRTTGSGDVIVAVIDSGYALEHEDLTDSWFTNDGEMGLTQLGDTCFTGTPADKATNGCDDDGNDFIDDWRGWDFSNDDNNPQAGDNDPDGSTHGTKSASLIAGRGNNGVGTASVNWEAKILPIQGLFDEGFGYSSDIAFSVFYAVEMGADVINMSLGGPYPDTFTRSAIRYAEENNVIVVAAAGNCGASQSTPDCSGNPSPGGMDYPGRYPETIAVGATTVSDSRASFSSYGPELDIVAPGSGSIQTPTWSSSNGVSLYDQYSYGTSFSSPIVAGAVGLVKGEFPEISRAEALALLANSADTVAGMSNPDWDEEYGFGRLNVNELLNQIDEYRQQLQKFEGQIAEFSDTVTPLVSTSSGHTPQTALRVNDPVITYCLSSPNTLCELTIEGASSGTVAQYFAQQTNNHGVAEIEWNPIPGLATGGNWNAVVRANNIDSQPERLYFTN